MDLCGGNTGGLWVGCNHDADQKEGAARKVKAATILVAVAQRSFIGCGSHCRVAMVDHCLSFHRRDVLLAHALPPTLLSFVESDLPHRGVGSGLVCVVYAETLASHRRFDVCCSDRVFSGTLHSFVTMVVYCRETGAPV